MLAVLELIAGLLSWPGGGYSSGQRRSVWHRLTWLAIGAASLYFGAAELSRTGDTDAAVATFIVALILLTLAWVALRGFVWVMVRVLRATTGSAGWLMRGGRRRDDSADQPRYLTPPLARTADEHEPRAL